MLKRRQVVSGLCTLALPRVATAQSRNVLRFVPRYGLATLDPVFTTDSVTRMCGLAVFESLYSVDENLVPKPQMAEGHVIEQDGRRWTIRLREGLRFHDGEAVLAKDCVASITRWMKRDLLSRSFAHGCALSRRTCESAPFMPLFSHRRAALLDHRDL
jgi:peptide/nickel transport system substrate-binding protein